MLFRWFSRIGVRREILKRDEVLLKSCMSVESRHTVPGSTCPTVRAFPSLSSVVAVSPRPSRWNRTENAVMRLFYPARTMICAADPLNYVRIKTLPQLQYFAS